MTIIIFLLFFSVEVLAASAPQEVKRIPGAAPRSAPTEEKYGPPGFFDNTSKWEAKNKVGTKTYIGRGATRDDALAELNRQIAKDKK